MPVFYDRGGNPISLTSWTHKLNDPDYCVIDITEFDDDHSTKIITRWTGIDLGIVPAEDANPSRHLIYQTVLSDARDNNIVYVQPWETERAAQLGHQAASQAFTDGHILSCSEPLSVAAEQLSDVENTVVEPLAVETVVEEALPVPVPILPSVAVSDDPNRVVLDHTPAIASEPVVQMQPSMAAGAVADYVDENRVVIATPEGQQVELPGTHPRDHVEIRPHAFDHPEGGIFDGAGAPLCSHCWNPEALHPPM